MAEFLTDLGIKNSKIWQNTEYSPFTQDSVFLVNLAKISGSDAVLDLGSGSGILLFLAVLKKGVKRAVGIELQEILCDMARRSAIMNNLDVEFIQGDVKDIRNLVKAESFDKVLCNPPYFTSCKALDVKSKMRSESTANLDDFINAAAFALRFGGELNVVIKAERLQTLFSSFERHNFQAKEMTLVYPKLSVGVDTVIVRARKGGKEGLITKTFVVADENGNFTREYSALYE